MHESTSGQRGTNNRDEVQHAHCLGAKLQTVRYHSIVRDAWAHAASRDFLTCLRPPPSCWSSCLPQCWLPVLTTKSHIILLHARHLSAVLLPYRPLKESPCTTTKRHAHASGPRAEADQQADAHTPRAMLGSIRAAGLLLLATRRFRMVHVVGRVRRAAYDQCHVARRAHGYCRRRSHCAL